MGREAEAHSMKEEILSIIEKRQPDDVTDTNASSSTPTNPPPTPTSAKASLEEDEDVSTLPEKKEVKKEVVFTHPPHMRAANRKKRPLS